jgi:hypothetical protein
MTQNTKVELHEKMVSRLKSRIEQLLFDLEEKRQDINDQSKNSAGDKHEVGRAMAYIEIEKLTQQLELNKKMLFELGEVDQKASALIAKGSLIETNRGRFFASIAYGKIEHQGDTYFAASTSSPLISSMLGKRLGDLVSFNGVDYKIEAIW